MLNTAPVSNPNDFKVVSFHNIEAFDFTPDLGCMYDGRAINGASGAPGIQAGEKTVLPYHIGHRLAVNLAKRVFNTSAPATIDPAGIPTGVPIWNEAKLEEQKNKYIADLYTEAKPVAQSETDKLMEKVEEYKKMVDVLLAKGAPVEEKEEVKVEAPVVSNPQVEPKVEAPKVYLDKQEVIAELEKREIKFDRRQTKEKLEKLLA